MNTFKNKGMPFSFLRLRQCLVKTFEIVHRDRTDSSTHIWYEIGKVVLKCLLIYWNNRWHHPIIEFVLLRFQKTRPSQLRHLCRRSVFCIVGSHALKQLLVRCLVETDINIKENLLHTIQKLNIMHDLSTQKRREVLFHPHHLTIGDGLHLAPSFWAGWEEQDCGSAPRVTQYSHTS